MLCIIREVTITQVGFIQNTHLDEFIIDCGILILHVTKFDGFNVANLKLKQVSAIRNIPWHCMCISEQPACFDKILSLSVFLPDYISNFNVKQISPKQNIIRHYISISEQPACFDKIQIF